MTDSATPSADDGLVSRARVIEEQPLASRAAAYAGLRDELARRLEPGATRPGGDES